ncbi:MAG: hypothetical protein HOC28_12330 [Bacteroidetes Order II. Incertae sedis bacterium]|nr:hypothetical protein [Bacteroidetes Order II. bacterium]
MATPLQQKRNMKIQACGTRGTVLALLFLVSACSSNGSIPGFESSGFDWFNSNQVSLSEDAANNRNRALLANGSDAELAVFNAVELAEQKRFAEARQILAQVRDLQPINSEGFHALTCAMAIAALREGQVKIFGRLAAQLDNATGRQVRVDANFVEIISLYRAINGLPLPVNAPPRFQEFKDRYFGIENAAS